MGNKCNHCGCRLGWIWYDGCSPRGYGDAVCGDIFEVRCWWCGIQHWKGAWREGTKINEGDQCVIDDSMRDLIGLRRLGIDQHNMGGLIG